MSREEMLAEYQQRLEATRQEKARLVAAENQLLGAIHVLQELGKASAEPPAAKEEATP